MQSLQCLLYLQCLQGMCLPNYPGKVYLLKNMESLQWLLYLQCLCLPWEGLPSEGHYAVFAMVAVFTVFAAFVSPKLCWEGLTFNRHYALIAVFAVFTVFAVFVVFTVFAVSVFLQLS
jgi:hypothetical protein